MSAISPLYNESSADEASSQKERRALTKHYHLPFLKSVSEMLASFSPFERLLLYVFSLLLAGSALMLLVLANQNTLVTVPSAGGELNEGVIGTPRFINPLLAISQVDQDLAALVYSGLMRATPEGALVPDLASSYGVENSGTTYTFHLRPDATFHDGTPVTADDVVFTVGLAQNPDIKSPRRADWEGVAVEALDAHTVVFTLPSAYAPFLENAQLGILPRHLWEGVTTDEFQFHALNTEPIGSGPFAVRDINTSSSDTPLDYTLEAFENFTLGAAYLSRITFRFFPNEEELLAAFAEGDVDSFAGVTPDQSFFEKRLDTHLLYADSTRVFGIFLNQNHAAVFTDAAVREALDMAVDREALVTLVLGKAGEPLSGPIPPQLLAATSERSSTTPEDRIASAREILEDGGWQQDETGHWTKDKQTLTFALATADTPELVSTAEVIAEAWRAVGVDVNVQVYPLAEFNPNVLRPRSYDAVLFGEVVGRTLDLFAFWHSSQRNDPGLNLALYANASADRLLASARVETNKREREKLYREFMTELANDKPAIFLYAPKFVYVLPQSVQGVTLGILTTPSERFLDVHHWYTDTEKVWDLFTGGNPLNAINF